MQVGKMYYVYFGPAVSFIDAIKAWGILIINAVITLEINV